MTDTKHTPEQIKIALTHAEHRIKGYAISINQTALEDSAKIIGNLKGQSNLIASAPDMLEALEECIEVLSNHRFFDLGDGESDNNDDVIDLLSKLETLRAKTRGQ